MNKSQISSPTPFTEGYLFMNKSQNSNLTPFALKCGVILICFGVLSHGASSTNTISSVNDQSHFNSAKDIIETAKQALSSDEQLKVLGNLKSYVISDPEDVMVLHQRAEELEKEYKSPDESGAVQQQAQIVNSAIAQCTHPELHAAISDLLEKERRGLPSTYLGPYVTQGKEETDRARFQYERLQALTTAAGIGKNHEALPVLRKMAAKDDAAGVLAVRAIGTIGDPSDLQNFIQEIKTKKRLIDIGPFGQQGLDAVVNEINNPSVPANEKQRVIGTLGLFHGREMLPTFIKLFNHPNRTVADIASHAMVSSAQPSDDELLREMLKSKNRDVRFNALDAINNRLWDAKYIPVFMHSLTDDADGGVKAFAATVLGQRKVYSARPALQAALKSTDGWVRSAAQGGLDKLDGKY